VTRFEGGGRSPSTTLGLFSSLLLSTALICFLSSDPHVLQQDIPTVSNLASEFRRAIWPWHNSRMTNQRATANYLLWIDSVGGFYVCTGSSVRIGQAVPGNAVELPLLADLSRHHATLHRAGESYVVEAVRDVDINGQKVAGSAPLPSRCELRLGKSLRLSFYRPHPLSTTARLDVVSNHRTQPSSAGVLLMAETCVLGPSAKSHVQCRHWRGDVVLFQNGPDLYCRAEGALQCGGKSLGRSGKIVPGEPVTGEGFSFSLELLG
jgi:hypothetical protein